MLEHLFEERAVSDDWLEGLNPEQREAVTHTGEGSVLVVAGAGSGKTKTLACRVAQLLQRGIRPERILLLTFSRRASREMLSRAERMTGDRGSGRVWGGTFHAVANRLLRLHGSALGLRPDFTVLDQSDAADLMDLIRGELGLGQGQRRFPRKETLVSIYSRVVNAELKLGEVLARHFPWCEGDADGVRKIFEAYTKRKREGNVLDYDDLLLFWKALLAQEAAGRAVAQRFDHVLVDEYQDTNALQADILALLAERGVRSLMVVGDDAQAIYGFRAATVRNILEFPQRFAGARVIRLERNYRSTQPILDASNAVIAFSPQRHEKTLWTSRGDGRRPSLVTCLDEADQCDVVCRSVLEHRERGVPLRRQAVLFRTGHHSDLLEVELSRRNIPFVKYGGLKFMEAAHVKDVLAVLRMLDNPHDEVSWFRVLRLLDGIGTATARRIMADLGVRSRSASPVARFVDDPPPVPITAAREIDELRTALKDCLVVTPASQVERVRRFLEPVFRRRYEAPEARLRDVDQLEGLAAAHGSRGAFLADLTLDPPSSTGDLAGPPLLDEDWLNLSTIHSAKGCEWDVVHLIHAADGMIPSDMATGEEDEIEEERRLLYVALTRARDALHVSFPLRYYRRPRGLEDPHTYSQLSRFLQPPEVLATFEQQATFAGDPTDDVEAAGAEVAGSAEVDAFLAGLWQS